MRIKRNVVPSFACPHCGKIAKDNYRPLATKYGADEVV